MILDPTKLCIYCGQPVKGVRKGEHVVPEALGGRPTLGKRVCGPCNTGVLSELDNELVSATPLALVAWEELARTARDAWDYNEQYDLALEARVLRGYEAPCLWPQLVFDGRAARFCADHGEMASDGASRAMERFRDSLLGACATLRAPSRRRRWIWQRVPRPPDRGRYPPRVFTKHLIEDVSAKSTFICRYHDLPDRQELLAKVERWNPDGNLNVEETWGEKVCEGRFSYRPRWVLRALVKLGVNLLAHLCKDSRALVRRETFPDASQFVICDQGAGPDPMSSGFVANEDVAKLGCPARAHKLRLSHDGRAWTMDCAFFGGRVGATVIFPGPNQEEWHRAEVVAPLCSDQWEVVTSPVLLPPEMTRMRVEWKDWTKVVPSVPIANLRTRVRVERKPARNRET